MCVAILYGIARHRGRAPGRKLLLHKEIGLRAAAGTDIARGGCGGAGMGPNTVKLGWVVGLGLGLSFFAATPSAAVVFDVEALAHSSHVSGSAITGTPLSTGIVLGAGDVISVSAAEDDLWSAGSDNPCSRTSNAGGLTGVGTYGGCDYGPLTLGGFSAPFGSLVGRVGTDLYLFGTSFLGPVSSAGELELFYWDTVTVDNSGEVAVSVDVVPEPGTLLLLGGGLLGLSRLRRRRG
jgi:hypothetical protein